MDNYQSFEQLSTNELSVLRHRLFMPWFELTDGQYCYGKMSTVNAWKNLVQLETAQGNWIIKRKGLFSRIFFIQQPPDVTIGTITPGILSRKIELKMDDGFEAEFSNKAFLSRTFTWSNSQYGDILTIIPALWSFKTPFKVSFDLNLTKNVPNLALLTLLGINLILMKQSQAAAAAH